MKLTLHTLMLIFALAGTAALGACENTWQGAGQDVEDAGEEMQDMY